MELVIRGRPPADKHEVRFVRKGEKHQILKVRLKYM